MARGFMYLAAIIDVYSRKIIAWDVSNTMTKEWVIELLEGAIKTHGKPEIHNSDQGSQYTSTEYIEVLKRNEIEISMDGRKRAIDNINIDRSGSTKKKKRIN